MHILFRSFLQFCSKDFLYILAFLRVVTLALVPALAVGGASGAYAQTPTPSSSEQLNTHSWVTEKAKFLDSDEFANVLYQTTGGFPNFNGELNYNDTADDIMELLLAEQKGLKGRDGKHGHIETTLTTLGALAGFSAQMGLREAVINTGEMNEQEAFVVIDTVGGEKFYAGDALNEALFEPSPGNLSIWTLVGGAAESMGAKNLIEMKPLAKHVMSSIGSKDFGVPRLPAENMPLYSPLELLDKYWNPMRNLLASSVKTPLAWPFVLSLATQKLIIASKDQIDPALAAKVVMEAAVPMAKIDPAKVRYAHFAKR